MRAAPSLRFRPALSTTQWPSSTRTSARLPRRWQTSRCGPALPRPQLARRPPTRPHQAAPRTAPSGQELLPHRVPQVCWMDDPRRLLGRGGRDAGHQCQPHHPERCRERLVLLRQGAPVLCHWACCRRSQALAVGPPPECPLTQPLGEHPAGLRAAHHRGRPSCWRQEMG